MKNLTIVFLILILISGCSGTGNSDEATPEIEEATPEKIYNDTKNIFVIFGQSNAASSGMTDQIYTNKNVFVYKNTQWVQATQALNMYSTIAPSDYQTYSLGWSFAEEYLKTHDQIRFISNAQGGTSVNYWRKGKPGYDELVKRLIPVRYKIAGFLFHQGEANSEDPEYWAEVVTLIMSQLRSHLNLVGERQVPIIIGQLSSMNPNYEYFNQEISNLYNTIEDICISDSSGLTTNPDTVHFDMAGMIEMGKRYHDCFLTF